MDNSTDALHRAVRKWLCLSSDANLFVEASKAVVAALEQGIPQEEVIRLITNELRTPPGYRDPQIISAIVTMQLHQLQHDRGKLIEKVEVASRDCDDRRIWTVDIVMQKKTDQNL